MTLRHLVGRSFDFKGIASRIWYAPIPVLMPIVYLAALWILGLIEAAPAVQLAEYYEAEVTGACSSRNVEMVKSVGAGEVID